MRLRSGIMTGLALLALSASSAFAQVATVDGVGGVATADPRYPLSYATVSAALADVKLVTNDVAGGNTISITAQTVSEAAGLLLNTNFPLTIQGAVPSSAYGGSLAHVKITPTGIGISAGVCAIVIDNKAGATVTLQDLIITPADGAAGGVAARAVQSYNNTAGTISTTNFTRVMFTAVRPTGHGSAGQPVINPLAHGASADTKTARYAELRSFSGGGANNLLELRNNAAPTAGALMTYNFTDLVVTHALIDGVAPPAAASKAGGIAIGRTAEIDVNINEGCVFSFNDGSGIRGVGTLAATSSLDITGTSNRPVIFLANGWMEDSVNTARNEGIQNDGTVTTISRAYFVGNYQEGIDKLSRNLTASYCYFANNGKDLDTTNGTAPAVTSAANVKLSTAATIYTLNNCTLFDNLGPTATTQNAIFLGDVAATVNLSNCILAGAGDGYSIGGAVNATVLNDTDVALVTAGSNALTGTQTIGAAVVRTSLYSVADDPLFVSTTFAPVWNGLGQTVTNLADYLRTGSPAGYDASRTPSASTIIGANDGTPASVADWTMIAE
jgi:hypothetical protein